MKTTLQAIAGSIALCVSALAAGGWTQQEVDMGGIPGGKAAISDTTSRLYVPLLQQQALSVLQPGRAPVRMELDFRPTAAAYARSEGRLFVLGMFDNRLAAIDEATGARSHLTVGMSPDNVIANDANGKVYVSNWGGLGGSGSVSIVDARTLAVTSVALPGSVAAMAVDRASGMVFVTGEYAGNLGYLAAITAAGSLVARIDTGSRPYSLAVDSRSARVYVGTVVPAPGAVATERVLTVYTADASLRAVSQRKLTGAFTYNPLAFALDPVEPGLYFGSGDSTTLSRIDADGNTLRSWNLGLGQTTLHDGRTFANGIIGIDADPATGKVFISAPTGSLLAEFDPDSGVLELVRIPGAVGFGSVRFWPDSNHLLVLDAAHEHKVTILRRETDVMFVDEHQGGGELGIGGGAQQPWGADFGE